MSLREPNQLLQAAGLPTAYPQADMSGADLAPYGAALDRLLHAHLPYPATVVDAHWTVLMANAACARLYGTDWTEVAWAAARSS